VSEWEAHLRASGLSAVESAAKAALFEKSVHKLREWRGANASAPHAFFIPGRLEFLGKHTDYAGGRSLVCAVERGVCLVAAPRADDRIRIFDIQREAAAEFMFHAEVEPSRGNWSNFPMTVGRRIARDFSGPHEGADIVFASDLPRASGMSSSSALIVAIFFALGQINQISQSEAYRSSIKTVEDLAGYLAAIESGAAFASFSGDGGVGTHGGSEDHVAILCSRAGFLRQYSFCPIRFEKEIRVPEQHAFVIGVSGVKADKTGDARDAYNGAAHAARQILRSWREATGRSDISLGAALCSSSEAGKRLQQILFESRNPGFAPDLLAKRLAQFSEESEQIVPGAATALASENFARLGELVDRSQALAETCLGNQVPETIDLARSARRLGALASSAFGAGFGGSVWALVPQFHAEEFRAAWALHYHQRFPELAGASAFFVTRAGPGLICFE